MSWQSYVDDHLMGAELANGGTLTAAAIFGQVRVSREMGHGSASCHPDGRVRLSRQRGDGACVSFTTLAWLLRFPGTPSGRSLGGNPLVRGRRARPVAESVRRVTIESEVRRVFRTHCQSAHPPRSHVARPDDLPARGMNRGGWVYGGLAWGDMAHRP